MLAIVAVLLLIPLAAYAISRRATANPETRRRTSRSRCAALFAVGLAAAGPFVIPAAPWATGKPTTTGLAVADGVPLADAKAGEMPPLVGQTAYAFNGRGASAAQRVPYLFYLIGGFDAATLATA